MTTTIVAKKPDTATLALAQQKTAALATRLGMTVDKLEFIRHAIANDAPDLQLEYFLTFCQAKKLDPTAREAYYIKRKTKVDGKYEDTWTIQVAIDGYRAVAERTGEYDGQDEPEFEYGEKGALVLARVRIYRKGIGRAFVGVAFWDEYVQTDFNGNPNAMWRRMKRNQLSKCAEGLGFRKAFPGALGGTYTPDEMALVDNQDNAAAATASETVPPGSTRTTAVAAKIAAQVQTIEQTAPADGDAPIDAESRSIEAEPLDARSAEEEKQYRADLRKAIGEAWQHVDATVRRETLARIYGVRELPKLTTVQLEEFLAETPALLDEIAGGGE